MTDRFDWAPEPAGARDDGRPVVALESTILTHGMPVPDNLMMLERVEAAIRAGGAEPATIAVVDGTVRIGLDAATAERLAADTAALKLSRADLAYACARGLTGGTTVAATMMLARAAGLRVFATGGIGGVHRGAETSFDVSADLDELARTPVVTVCAGAKAILDLPKTLEALETRGVPVVAVGQDAFPAFWSRDSGLPAPLRLDAPADIARFVRMRDAMRGCGHGGVLIATPVPASAEIPFDEMGELIERAVAEASAGGVTGKAVTPWLLARLLELTGGRSLAANIALVENNAALAARIAAALPGD